MSGEDHSYVAASDWTWPIAEELLYGIPGAEELHDDPAACFEADIEPWWDDDPDDTWQIEEWTSLPAREHLPTVDWIIDHVTEWMADRDHIADVGMDQWERHAVDAPVIAALDAWLDTWASQVGYRYADKLVRVLTVTRGDDGLPLLDGEPLYRPAAHTGGLVDASKLPLVGDARVVAQAAAARPEEAQQ